ncbi:MAG: carbohydrate binding domain-containing protein [Bacteroidales bacterium]|nr:carbohydrate binding domain-containing protein [Bacteroidales bacterium]
MKRISKMALACVLAAVSACSGQVKQMDIMPEKPGAEIQSTMYGIFFEDINFAADGGLYAELVKNRSFEFPNHLQGWKTFGNVELRKGGPFERNPHYVHLGDPGHREKHTGLENEGFMGIGVKEGETYNFSVWARLTEGQRARIRVELADPRGFQNGKHYFSRDTIIVDSREWKKYSVSLKSPLTDERAVLRIYLETRGHGVDLEHVSLFPADTWMGHENGLRKDLAQALYDLHPGVFRFPGGCIVEGTEIPDRYQWKNTIGPVENRPLNLNRWLYTFRHRLFPDYYQSYGLGFYEYFLLSEEIGAEPLPILNCGLVCQFQNDDEKAHFPVNGLQPLIQDALDLIEFANGPASSKWGGIRAQMGHPEPFNLKYLGIGNEQWGSLYPERLEPFLKVLREKHPEIKIVGSSGPDSEGEQFDYLWPEMKRLNVDLVDEHFYRPESWFLSQAARYDSYDRNGPKVFAGEYACHGAKKEWNHYNAALMEAAFMTGLERNADIVHMATYAPLFAHVEGWQWRPDLIWFDNLRSMRTVSWHVQSMYSHYKGTNVLPLTMDGKAVTGAEGQDGLYASAVTDSNEGRIYVKVVNVSDSKQSVKLNFNGSKLKAVEQIVLSSPDPDAENTLDQPDRIAPVSSRLGGTSDSFKVSVPAQSFVIYVFEK